MVSDFKTFAHKVWKSPRKKSFFLCELCLISKICLVLVLLSASVEIFFVSLMRDFYFWQSSWHQLYKRPDVLKMNRILHMLSLPQISLTSTPALYARMALWSMFDYLYDTFTNSFGRIKQCRISMQACATLAHVWSFSEGGKEGGPM